MYYHIKIVNRSAKEPDLRATNLSWDDVTHRLRIPYDRTDPVTLEGTTVSAGEIRTVRIFETDENLSTPKPDDVNLNLYMGFEFHHGEREITNELIKGPPGEGRIFNTSSSGGYLKLVDLFDHMVTDKHLQHASRKLFVDKHYARSVEEAFKCLNNAVKEKSGLEAKDGAALMRAAFSAKSPVLRFNELQTKSDQDEQLGFMEIFAGSMTGIRNPRAHDHQLADSPGVALEFLILANHLMRKLDLANKQESIT